MRRDLRNSALCAVLVFLSSVQAARGQPPGDDGTELSDVQVSAPTMVPVPEVGEPQPLFSVEALQGFACQARHWQLDQFKARARMIGSSDKTGLGLEYNHLYNRTLRARELTQAAEQVRREAARGLRTQKEVEDAELARQEAVKAFQAQMRWIGKLLTKGQGFPLNWIYNPALGVDPMDPYWREIIDHMPWGGDVYLIEADADSVIENISTRTTTERGRRVLVVTGTMRNIRDHRVLAQGLLITVLDRAGKVLDMAVAASNRSYIRPGKTLNFSYPLANPPPNAHSVRVSFAGPGMVTRREYATAMQCNGSVPSETPPAGRAMFIDPVQRARSAGVPGPIRPSPSLR